MKAGGARHRTRAALWTSSDRRSRATGLSRWARPAGCAALALAAALAAGCHPYVEGNGVYGEEDRTPAQTFTGVEVHDGIEVTVTSGAAQQRVIVSADQNVVQWMTTRVSTDTGSGPVLHLSIDKAGWTSTNPPRAVVDLAELRYVNAQDDSHVSASGVATLLLSVQAYQRSDVFVMGSGGGRIEVVADDATVDAGTYPLGEGALVTLTSRSRAEVHSDGPVAGSAAAGSTLENFGSGTCAGVVADAGATILCPP